MTLLKSYYALCKPNVVYMMLICAFVGMLLAEETVSSFSYLFISLFGIALCASSAAAINQVIDRKTDASMTRTDQRPLPKGELSVMHASIFAMTIGVIGALILFFYVNTLTMLLTIGSLIGYAFIYSVYLKRATPQNIVIGGLAGAAPPLLGWSSVTNTIDPYALLLVLIIFVWTPPHFWALAVYRVDDYADAEVPMLPVQKGVPFTKQHILLYTVLLIVATMLPYTVQMFGEIYLISALLLGLIFLVYSLRLYRDDTNALAMPTFAYSIFYLAALFAAMLIDHFIYL